MKLLILAGEFPPFRGGIATYVREMAEAAVGLGYEVTVAAPSYFESRHEADAGYPFRVLRFAGGQNTARGILDKALWTRRLAAAEDFDVVHAADWPFFLPLAVSPFRRRSRCLVTFHGTEINQMRRRSRRVALGLARFWSGWALSVANSRYTAEHLRRTFPRQRADRLRAIPLGVRPPAGLVPLERSAARARLGLADGDFVVLSLGRVVPRKGHHVTVAALARLPAAMRAKTIWYVVGPQIDAAYSAGIEAAAAESGVRAIFAGALPDESLETVFAAADVLCGPSVWGANGEFEGFGLVYLEAALRGLPSIATTVGGIPDAIHDGETGILAPPEDPDAVGQALIGLWQDPARRSRMGEAAKAHARAATWSRVAALTYAP
jgi:glycosyltransferase involved in cell wall biosynthesis